MKRSLLLALIFGLVVVPVKADETHLITPCRFYSTLDPGVSPLGDNEVRTFFVQGSTGWCAEDPGLAIPVGASGLMMSVTVQNAHGPGFLRFYNAQLPAPLNAVSLTISEGIRRTTFVAAALGPDLALPDLAVFSKIRGGNFDLSFTAPSPGPPPGAADEPLFKDVDVIIDIMGYLIP